MRRLFHFNMITLDGFFEGPNRELDWHNVDAEFNEFAIEQLSQIGLLVFGRITYQLMASYWPTQSGLEDDPIIAGLMNRIPKVVVSRTLQRADWENTRLISTNLTEEILKLKRQPGKDIAVFGSANLLSSLIQSDLVDEHRVIVNPIVLGRGVTLYSGMQGRLNLKLIKTKIFHSGNVLLYYEPAATK